MPENQAVIARLRAAGCVFAEEEAAVIQEAAPDDPTLHAMVERRAAGEPLEQVVGYADFCGIRIRLRPAVFVPRIRSELLIREAIRTARNIQNGATVLDLCCGSGALGLALRHQVPEIDLYATDLEPAAVACARDNFGPGQHKVLSGDLFTPLPATLKNKIDVILANVPYVATRHIPLLPAEARDHEPHTALDGGEDGLDIFRAVTGQAPAWLTPGGKLFSEITEAQITAAVAAVRAAGLSPEVTHDEDLEATVITATT